MKKAVLIIISILFMTGLIFYYGFKVNESKFNKFNGNGYIISKKYDKEGNYIKSEKYYFNEGTKYKENYNKKIVFQNANNEESKVEEDSFIHYDDNSLSTLKKSSILNLDSLKKDSTIKYYNIYNGSVLENKNNIYSINNIKTKIDFQNFIIKINENKYLLVGKNLTLKMADTEKKLDYGYYEIEYIDGNIVRIENNEVSYQNVSTDIYINLDNGINFDVNSKNINKNNEKLLNLGEMTIESNDNIDLIPESENNTENSNSEKANKENESKENNKNENTKNNPINGIGSGVIDSTNPNESEVNENIKEVEPQFSVTETTITANKFQSSILVNDPSNLLNGDITVKIINSTNNRIVYQTKEIQGTMKIDTEVENLSPSTSYLFIVTSSYNKGENIYTRDFIQKSFITESIGIDIVKDYFSTDTLSFTVEKKDYSTIKAFDASLLDSNNNIIKTINVSFEDNNFNNFMFNSLHYDTSYKLRISNYLYEDSVITDSYINDKEYKTLKRNHS